MKKKENKHWNLNKCRAKEIERSSVLACLKVGQCLRYISKLPNLFFQIVDQLIYQNAPKITQELCMYYLYFGTNPLEDKLTRMALWDSTLVKAQQQRNVTFSIYEKRQTVLVPANL